MTTWTPPPPQTLPDGSTIRYIDRYDREWIHPDGTIWRSVGFGPWEPPVVAADPPLFGAVQDALDFGEAS